MKRAVMTVTRVEAALVMKKLMSNFIVLMYIFTVLTHF